MNPAANELERTDSLAYAQALARGPRPRSIRERDSGLPANTASGIDRHGIGELPVGVGHHAATLATETEVHALFERVAGTPDARTGHPDLAAAEARLRAWSAA